MAAGTFPFNLTAGGGITGSTDNSTQVITPSITAPWNVTKTYSSGGTLTTGTNQLYILIAAAVILFILVWKRKS